MTGRYITRPYGQDRGLNIEHYRKLLANETNETRRQMIARLLAEEEAKLAGFRKSN